MQFNDPLRSVYAEYMQSLSRFMQGLCKFFAAYGAFLESLCKICNFSIHDANDAVYATVTVCTLNPFQKSIKNVANSSERPN